MVYFVMCPGIMHVVTLELYSPVLGPAESNTLVRTVRATACQEHGSLHNRLDVVEKVKSNLNEWESFTKKTF